MDTIKLAQLLSCSVAQLLSCSVAQLLMERFGWGYEDLARALGIRRQVVHRAMTKSVKTERRDKFHLGVIAVAFKNGMEAEAMFTVLGYRGEVQNSTVARAAMLYADLKPTELEHLLKAEEVTFMSPLSAEVIISIMKKLRS